MHGYELIGEFEERTGGRWRPSPGSVYPTLAQLEDEGLVRAIDDDGKKRYELTDAGRTWLDEHADDEQTPPWERAGRGGRGDLRRLAGEIFGQLRQLGRFGSAAQQDKAKEILGRTRTELYAVLAEPPAAEDSDDDFCPLSGPQLSSEHSVAGDAAGEEVDRAGDGRGDEAFQLRRLDEPGDGFQRAHRSQTSGLFGGRS